MRPSGWPEALPEHEKDHSVAPPLLTPSATAMKFLKDGDKVKVSLRFRGRELGHTQLGREVMEKFIELCSEVSTVDKKPNMEGRSLVMFLAPKNDK